AERIFRAFDRIDGLRKRRQLSPGKLLEQALEHAADEGGIGRRDLAEVEREIFHLRVRRGDLRRVPDPGLADLDEAPPGAQEAEARGNEIAGEGIEHDVEALAARGLPEVV